MMRLWTASLLALTIALPAGAQSRLPSAFTQELERAGIPRSAVSVVVAPVPAVDAAPAKGRAARPRLSYRAQTPRNPASVMKLVTTYAALDRLGPDFTWTNRVYVNGPVEQGVLDGDLVLRGSGDPKLVVERLDALLRQVVDQGVREVRGDILLDRSIFTVPEHDAAAFDGEPLRAYNAAPDGLLVNFKSLLFTFTPDPAGQRTLVRSEPPIVGVALPAELPLAEGPCDDWRGRLQADFSSPDRVAFAGSYPAACGEQVWPVAYVAPQLYAARVVQAMWLGAGGQLHGQVREARTPASARLQLSAASLPLADIVADINKFSNNVMAQQLFLTLSSQARGHGSFEASRRELRRWWRQRLGAATPAPTLDNGSGLSRQERTSAAALSALLRLAANGPHAAVFEQSLGLAGVDGTVARMRGRGVAPEVLGNARLKTGTLRDVNALAGYATGRSGQRYSLVVLVHHDKAPAARAAIDRLVEWVVNDTPPSAPAPQRGPRP